MHLLEGRVVAAIVHELLILQVQNVGTSWPTCRRDCNRGADGVEKVGVVGYDDHSMWILLRKVVVEPENLIQSH